MTRGALKVAHRWLGLVLALPMLVQGLTGCVLAVTPIWEALRPVPAMSAGAFHPASEIMAAAAQPGLVPVQYGPPEPGQAAVVGLAPPGQRAATLQVIIDPASLAVLGTRKPSALYRWVHSLHEMLLLPLIPGRSIVGWFGVGLLLLGLSGVVLWWPTALTPGRWRRAMTVTKGASGARLMRELHGAVGFWVSAMLVVMSLGGVSLAFQQTLRDMLGIAAGAPGGGQQRGDAHESLDIDAVLQRAIEATPGASVMDVRLSNPPGRPVMVRMSISDALEGTPLAVAMVDPAGRRVLSLQDPRTQSTAALILGWLRSLHFGEAFGMLWRVLVALFGVALPLLAMTGVTLWLLRRRNRLRLSAQRQAALHGAVAE